VVDLSFLAEEPLPAAALIVGGLLSIAVAIYGHRDDSSWDEVGTFFAFVLGAAMIIMAIVLAMEKAVNWLTLVIFVLLALTLFLKPMREIPWAGVLGALVGGAAAVASSFALPSKVFGIDEWIILVIIFLVVGTIVHTLFHFLEDVLTIARMVLDWKPTMVIVGIVSIAEGVLILMDRSILSFI
jgi:hypothetical protein